MAAVVTLTMNPALDIATTTDRVIPSHKLCCAAPRYDPGGGGINVARAINALGGDAIAIFPIGGPAGEMLRYLLDEDSVAHRALQVAGYTRESLNVEELATGKQFRFILPGPEISARDQERCLDELALAASHAGYIVAGGSLPPGVPTNFYARVGELAKRLGGRFVLDSSGAGLSGASSGVYLVRPSLRELEAMTGEPIHTEADQERAARRLVEDGRQRDRRAFPRRRRGSVDDGGRERAPRCRPRAGAKHGWRRRQHAGRHRSQLMSRAGPTLSRPLRHGGGRGRAPAAGDRPLSPRRCQAPQCGSDP